MIVIIFNLLAITSIITLFRDEVGELHRQKKNVDEINENVSKKHVKLDKNKKRADSRLTEQPNKNANESQKIMTESIEELDSPFEAGSLL